MQSSSSSALSECILFFLLKDLASLDLSLIHISNYSDFFVVIVFKISLFQFSISVTSTIGVLRSHHILNIFFFKILKTPIALVVIKLNKLHVRYLQLFGLKCSLWLYKTYEYLNMYYGLQCTYKNSYVKGKNVLRRVGTQVCVCVLSVSYTHLDVYKRQGVDKRLQHYSCYS